MFERATDIDSHAEVVSLFEELTGQECGTTGAGYTWDSVPLFYQGGGYQCYYKRTPSSANDFNCGALNPSAKRL